MAVNPIGNDKALADSMAKHWLNALTLPAERALITGSRAYGRPRGADSDLDLVVLVDPATASLLRFFYPPTEAQKKKASAYGQVNSLVIPTRRSLPDLNLILVTKPSELADWRRGTEFLIEERKVYGMVTRDRACEVFAAIRAGKEIPPYRQLLLGDGRPWGVA